MHDPGLGDVGDDACGRHRHETSERHTRGPALRSFDKGGGRTMKRLLGVSVALVRGVGPVRGRRSRPAGAGTSASFHRLASRFRCDRRGGPVGAARPHRARARAVQGEIHHRRRRRTAEGDAGDHPDQAQERRQSAVQPHQRAGFELLLRLPQRSRRSAAPATTSPMCSCRRGSRARNSTRSTPRSRASGTRSR